MEMPLEWVEICGLVAVLVLLVDIHGYLRDISRQLKART